MDQIVAVKPHAFHKNAALGEDSLLTLCVNNHIAVINAVVVQGGNHASHGSLPFPAVHYADHFGNGHTGKHGYTGLTAESISGLDDDLDIIDLADGIIKVVGTVLMNLNDASLYMKE